MTRRHLTIALSFVFAASLRADLVQTVQPLPGVSTGVWSDNGIWGPLVDNLQYPGDTTSQIISVNPKWNVTIGGSNAITLQPIGPSNLLLDSVEVTIQKSGSITVNQPLGPLSLTFGGTYIGSGDPALHNSGSVNIQQGQLTLEPTSGGGIQGSVLVNGGDGEINLQAVTGAGLFAVLDVTGTGNTIVNPEFLNQGTINLAGFNNTITNGGLGGSTTLDNQGDIRGGGFIDYMSVENSGTVTANNTDPLTFFCCSFSNTGTVTVDSGSTLTLNTPYTQTAGKTKVLGTLNGFGTLDIEGGSIGGSGTIDNSVILNGGVFAPGDPQTTTINGAFTMNGGSIDLTILGSDPSDQDHIIFGGPADFSGGTINLNIPLSVNLNGDSLDLFTFEEGVSGNLPAFNFVNGQNYHVNEVTNESGTHFVFSGNTVTAGTPEPASLILCAAALVLLVAARRRRTTAR